MPGIHMCSEPGKWHDLPHGGRLSHSMSLQVGTGTTQEGTFTFLLPLQPQEDTSRR
jgi:hypothetical protein